MAAPDDGAEWDRRYVDGRIPDADGANSHARHPALMSLSRPFGTVRYGSAVEEGPMRQRVLRLWRQMGVSQAARNVEADLRLRREAVADVEAACRRLAPGEPAAA